LRASNTGKDASTPAFCSFDEGRIEGLDVLAEAVSELEVALALAASLHRHRQGGTASACGASDARPRRPERPASGTSRPSPRAKLEAVVDHLLRLTDSSALIVARSTLNVQQTLLERAAVIEGEHEQRRVVSGHRGKSSASDEVTPSSTL
jgi:hypothetical protein